MEREKQHGKTSPRYARCLLTNHKRQSVTLRMRSCNLAQFRGCFAVSEEESMHSLYLILSGNAKTYIPNIIQLAYPPSEVESI